MKTGILVGLLIAGVMTMAFAEDSENKAATSQTTDTAKVSGPLGADTNPVRCDMPRGERAYLQRLRDADGKPPRFHRVGSFGAGPYGNILDGYEVTAGTNTLMVFMDMYHPGFVETNAIPGFTILNR